MQRISASTDTATSTGQFTEGSATDGVAATVVKASWLNSIQEEIANVIEAAGLDLNAEDSTQLQQAVAAMIADAADATEYALKEHTHTTDEITDLLTTARSYTAVQAYTPVALTITDGAATWDLTAAPVAEITLTADVTLTVTNPVPGTSPILRVTQDATGGWSIIWPSAWLWAGKAAHDVTTDAGAVDLVQVDVGSDGTVCARGDSDYGEVS